MHRIYVKLLVNVSKLWNDITTFKISLIDVVAVIYSKLLKLTETCIMSKDFNRNYQHVKREENKERATGGIITGVKKDIEEWIWDRRKKNGGNISEEDNHRKK